MPKLTYRALRYGWTEDQTYLYESFAFSRPYKIISFGEAIKRNINFILMIVELIYNPVFLQIWKIIQIL